MERFEDGTMTMLAQDQTYDIDYSDEASPEKVAGYISKLAGKNFFQEGLRNYISKKKNEFDSDFDIENADVLYNYVKNAYLQAGFVASREKGWNNINLSSVKNWIAGKITPSREEVYRLAFCLHMSIAEVNEFLVKACLTAPINYKSVSEIVYSFCLRNQKNYREAHMLIKSIDAATPIENPVAENNTACIEEAISRIVDETTLRAYLLENQAGFAMQHRAAIEELKKQIVRAAVLAEKERIRFFCNQNLGKIGSEDDIPAILSVILAYEARANANGEDVYETKISKSAFPKQIRDNFPQPQQLATQLKADNPSAELVRKSLILFAFYNMFADLRLKNKENSGGKYFNEFIDAVDDVLNKSGYVQFYWKHPYDWMFAYCAGADEPLDALRQMIGIFYTDKSENYSEGNRVLQKQQ